MPLSFVRSAQFCFAPKQTDLQNIALQSTLAGNISYAGLVMLKIVLCPAKVDRQKEEL
jgi:hypothetical protein